MRIVDVHVIPIAIGDPPLRNSWGVHEPVALRSIVRLETDDGCVGWGETYGGEEILGKLQGAAKVVIGQDPAQFNRTRISSIIRASLPPMRPPCSICSARRPDGRSATCLAARSATP